MIVIKTSITTVGPLSIAMPVPEGARENAFRNAPVMARGIDADGNLQLTGYLPATTLRGFLRRAAVLPDMAQAAKKGAHYTLQRAYSELIGQDSESEKSAEDVDLIAIRAARDASPVLDLFGSGLGIKSRLSVSHFLPAVNVLPQPFSGTRKDLDDTEEAFELLADPEKETFFARSAANSQRARAAALVGALERKIRTAKRVGMDLSALEAEKEVAQALADKYEAQMGDMRNSSRTILTWWALPAGLVLSGRMVIERDQPRDIDLIMRGLAALSLNPVLGAHRARGCGEIAGKFDFYRDGTLFRRVVSGDYAPAEITDFSEQKSPGSAA
ncbi:MAG: hypothetical protein IPJ33_15610 [Gammaproteobacteria bacterium]|nr:hypothetical protein [Gammaproteobacteria bacterium]MBK7729867.1 hypothetical protein [Gammaproteobacteria bacterium]